MPTGTVTLTSGSYRSAAVTLTNGEAAFTLPGFSLAAGTDTVTAVSAVYTPDAASSA